MAYRERVIRSLNNAFKRAILLPGMPVEVVQIVATRLLEGPPERQQYRQYKNGAMYVMQLLQSSRDTNSMTLVLSSLFLLLTLDKASRLSTITRYVIDFNQCVRDYLYRKNNPDFQ